MSIEKIQRKSVSDIAKGTASKYDGITIGNRSSLLFIPSGGATSAVKSEDSAKAWRRRTLTRGKERPTLGGETRKGYGFLKGVGREVARGIGRAGEIVMTAAETQTEAWRRRKLGEYPYDIPEAAPVAEGSHVSGFRFQAKTPQAISPATVVGSQVTSQHIPYGAKVVTLRGTVGCHNCRAVYNAGETVFQGISGTLFCPNCGARMKA